MRATPLRTHRNDDKISPIEGEIFMYHYIFFDLDGTLTDSKEGILNFLRYAF